MSVEDIVQDIVNQIRATDPSFSLQVGTPERKIIEAVATQVAQAQADFGVLDSQGNIDAMTGGRLDAYLNLFGFSRQLATSASGEVTFSRSTPAAADILIPFGTAVKASDTDPDTPDVIFTTTQSATLATGTSSVDVPVIASTPGSIGNVAASTVSGFATLTGIAGITDVTNALAMTGGLDFETDEQLRVRFKNGIFRNMAGTYDQFMALALSGEQTTKANVIGPLSRYQEYMLVPNADDAHMGTSGDPNGNYDPTPDYTHKRTTAPSDIPYSKYTYADQNFVTDGTVGGKVFKPDRDYFFNRTPVNPASGSRAADAAAKAAHQPNITILGHGSTIWPSGMEPGSVVLVEHAYMSNNSRNSIPNGIMNCVDIFVNGEKNRAVTSQEMYPPAGQKLNTTVGRWTYYNNFRRVLDGSTPAVAGPNSSNERTDNRLFVLFWQPIMSAPDTLSIKNADGNTYTFYKARFKSGGEYYYNSGHTIVANYFETEEVGPFFGTIRARSGIEFRHVRTYAPGDGASPSGPWANDIGNSTSVFVGQNVTIKYSIDQNIRELQAIIERNKQVTTDVLVHKATPRYFRFYVTVIYTPGANPTTTKALIDTQLQAFLQNQYYGAVVQLSDILQTIHNTPGVDNVRWTFEVDSVTDRVAEVSKDGSTTTTTYNEDFFLQDNELATAPDVPVTVVTVRTQNTWSA